MSSVSPFIYYVQIHSHLKFDGLALPSKSGRLFLETSACSVLFSQKNFPQGNPFQNKSCAQEGMIALAVAVVISKQTLVRNDN